MKKNYLTPQFEGTGETHQWLSKCDPPAHLNNAELPPTQIVYDWQPRRLAWNVVSPVSRDSWHVILSVLQSARKGSTHSPS